MGKPLATLRSLQYLRAIAALGVVLFHAADRRGVGGFSLGQAGVDIFFVLSGFMMWLISERASRTPGQFLLERIARIAPTYWLATLVVLGLWVIGVRQGLDHPELGHTLKSFLFIPDYYPGKDKIYPLLIPGWTLNDEMFFYVLFALCLFLPRRRLAAMTVALAGLVAIDLVLHPAGPLASTYTDPILLEFLAGMWIGAAFTRPAAKANPIAATALILAGFILFPIFAIAWPDAPRVLGWGIPGAMIVSGAAMWERARAVPNIPWLLLLGDASYSIYLWHVPSNTFSDRLAEALHAPVPVAIAMMFAGGVITGLAAYFLIERPVRRAIQRRLSRRSTEKPLVVAKA